MRVNVYGEELTARVVPVAKIANGVVFKGVCCFLSFKDEKVMHTPGDEDTPAVTFWFQDEDNSFWRDKLRSTFEQAIALLDNPKAFEEAIEKAQEKGS